MRRNDVASTSFRRRVPIRFLINQCQIITFLILKYDIMENSRIELRGIVLPVQIGGLLGGGGAKGMLAPPSQIIGGGAWPPLAPPGPPSSYAYVSFVLWNLVIVFLCQFIPRSHVWCWRWSVVDVYNLCKLSADLEPTPCSGQRDELISSFCVIGKMCCM